MALCCKAALRLDRGMLGNAVGGGTGTVSQVLTGMQWRMSTQTTERRDMPEPLGQGKAADHTGTVHYIAALCLEVKGKNGNSVSTTAMG